MATIARKIDALGGAAKSDAPVHQAFNKGWNSALELAEPIAELADVQIEELIEMVEDMLNGTDLAKWAAYARRTVDGIKHERER
jgi:hypothetical protein